MQAKTNSSDLFSLNGKVALVTGASSGLGEHFAQVLANAGAKVVLAARRKEKLEQTVATITASGGQAIAVSLDVTDSENITRAFDTAEATFGTVNLLINNAGVAASKRYLNVSDDDWDFIMNTNLKAAWQVSKMVAQRLIDSQKTGSIVNIASILGLRVGFGESAYAISKAGVVQMTKSMALELGHLGIQVNAICPGYFKTEMNAGYFDSEKGKQFIKQTPAKRIGQLDELNGPLLLLSGDGASFINGITLPVDGGHLVSSL